jgi:hypothetical protein
LGRPRDRGCLAGMGATFAWPASMAHTPLTVAALATHRRSVLIRRISPGIQPTEPQAYVQVRRIITFSVLDGLHWGWPGTPRWSNTPQSYPMIEQRNRATWALKLTRTPYSESEAGTAIGRCRVAQGWAKGRSPRCAIFCSWRTSICMWFQVVLANDNGGGGAKATVPEIEPMRVRKTSETATRTSVVTHHPG